MTENELVMLISGIAIGIHLMNLLHAYWAQRDARRSQAQARAAIKQAAGDQYLNSLRLYQLQQRTGARR